MFAEILDLLLSPIERLLRRKRGTPERVAQFYKSAAWKRARFEVLSKSPRCVYCGHSAKDGRRMNVDHVRPISKRWDLRLDPRNLQTTCASCNWGKGSR
jgi:5-methylcytosine-specific restriction endonuclease McrA